MRTITIRQVDAFTTTPHGGNPAGVVLDCADLTPAQMQAIAREINASETAFVLPPERPDTDLKIRWFSPSVEVPLCGHATVAAFHVLAEEKAMGMGGDGRFAYTVDTLRGPVPVETEIAAGNTTIRMGMALPAFERVPHMKVDLVRLLAINAGEFDSSVPLLKETNLYVFVKRLHTLFSLKPNFAAIGSFLAARNLTGLCIYTLETVDRESRVHSRFFAPTVGINEDPVTGTANGPLGAILYNHGLVTPAGEKCAFQAEQGDAIGRRGRLTVEVDGDGKRAAAIRVAGNAITILKGDMVIE